MVPYLFNFFLSAMLQLLAVARRNGMVSASLDYEYVGAICGFWFSRGGDKC